MRLSTLYIINVQVLPFLHILKETVISHKIIGYPSIVSKTILHVRVNHTTMVTRLDFRPAHNVANSCTDISSMISSSQAINISSSNLSSLVLDLHIFVTVFSLLNVFLSLATVTGAVDTKRKALLINKKTDFISSATLAGPQIS